jgi:hypothetical protein
MCVCLLYVFLLLQDLLLGLLLQGVYCKCFYYYRTFYWVYYCSVGHLKT